VNCEGLRSVRRMERGPLTRPGWTALNMQNSNAHLQVPADGAIRMLGGLRLSTHDARQVLQIEELVARNHAEGSQPEESAILRPVTHRRAQLQDIRGHRFEACHLQIFVVLRQQRTRALNVVRSERIAKWSGT